MYPLKDDRDEWRRRDGQGELSQPGGSGWCWRLTEARAEMWFLLERGECVGRWGGVDVSEVGEDAASKFHLKMLLFLGYRFRLK